MSSDCEPSTTYDSDKSNNNNTEILAAEGKQQTEPKEQQFLAEMRNWIEKEAKFYGRKDDEFLLIFLCGSKFNMKKSKSKMTKYYENRKKIPQWWANRDLKDIRIKSLMQHRVITALIDRDPTQPISVFAIASRVGPNLNNFDVYMKMKAIFADVILRRNNCQMNGLFLIIDCRLMPQWAIPHFMSPIVLKNVVKSFVLAMPVMFKGIVFLNTSPVIVTIVNLIKPFLSKKLQKRFRLYESDWSNMFEYVPKALVPEEYGGTAGPLQIHEEAFLQEVQDFSEYLLDDMKYGYQHQIKVV